METRDPNEEYKGRPSSNCGLRREEAKREERKREEKRGWEEEKGGEREIQMDMERAFRPILD